MIFNAIFMLSVWACGQSDSQTEAQAESKKSSQQLIEQSEKLFEHYETLRVLLVNDRSEGYSEPLSALVSSCAQYTEIKRCGEISAAATTLKANDFKDLEAARKEFGDLSKAMVALVSDVPELQSKLNVFSCPMAQDYPNWIQPSTQLENPYMGQRMLKCGKAIEWADL